VDEKSPEPVSLFPHLPPNGLRQFEITAELPGSTRPPMSAIAPAVNVPMVFAEVFAACQSLPDFELHIKPLGS
jgi:hypothetical protein